MTAPRWQLWAPRTPGGAEPLVFPRAAAGGPRSHGRRDPNAAAATRPQVGPSPAPRVGPRRGKDKGSTAAELGLVALFPRLLSRVIFISLFPFALG